MRTIITTVGTSLIGNAARHCGKAPNEVQDSDIKRFLSAEPPEKLSAELNSLHRLNSSQDEVILLHTNTIDGEKCAKLLASHLENGYCKRVRVRRINLKQDEKHMETHGLRDLVEIMMNEISNSRKNSHEIIINATGGYKAETAFATIIGQMMGVPVVYLYEQFKIMVELPPLPVTWNTDLVLENRSFFEWMEEEPRLGREVETRLFGLQASDVFRTFITPFDDEEGYRWLSAVGHILYLRFKKEGEEATNIAYPSPALEQDPDKKVEIRGDHHYPKGIREFAKTIAKCQYVEKITPRHFESSTRTRIKSVDDSGIIHILFCDNQKGCNLLVQTTSNGKLQTRKVADLLDMDVFS